MAAPRYYRIFSWIGIIIFLYNTIHASSSKPLVNMHITESVLKQQHTTSTLSEPPNSENKLTGNDNPTEPAAPRTTRALSSATSSSHVSPLPALSCVSSFPDPLNNSSAYFFYDAPPHQEYASFNNKSDSKK